MHRSLVLASASPRRKQLLEEAGLQFEVLAAPVEEELKRDGFSPAEFAEESALAKAAWAFGRRPEAAVLGADTIVVLGEEILGKPQDREDARRMLSRLSGRTHRVITGFAVLAPGTSRSGHIETQVRFRRLSGADIDRYAGSGEPMGKAGAYAIQGRGGSLIDRIEGSYTNVVGLPVPEVLAALSSCGALEDSHSVSMPREE